MSLGLIAATFVVAMLPRLYSYPKIIVPALGLLACWRYIDGPRRGGWRQSRSMTVVAFYLRFDYGALCGVTAAVALTARHWGAWRELSMIAIRYGLVVVLLCVPYVLLSTRVRWVLTSGPSSGRLTHLLRGDDVVSLAIPERPEEGPFVRFRPAGPLATVRWKSEVGSGQWPALEERYSLHRARMIDDEAWQYVLLDPSPATLTRLMADPSVAGVTNVDSQGRVLREPPWSVVRRWLRIPVMESPLLNQSIAAVWLYDVLFLTPLLAASVLVVRVVRRRVVAGETPKVLATIAIGVLFNVFQIRGNLDSRLPDVIVPAAVLWVWMVCAAFAAPQLRRARVAWRFVTGAVATVSLLALWLVVDAYAGSVSHLEATELFSTPGKVVRRISGTIEGLRRDPLDQFAPPDSRGLPALTRYVNRCTAPTDFLVVLGYLPEVYFFADRRIGGGNVQFHANLGAAPEQQRIIVSRLQRERVPIVIWPENEIREVEQAYPIVMRHIDERYELAQESGFGEGRLFRVLVDRHITPTHIDQELGLPCFRG